MHKNNLSIGLEEIILNPHLSKDWGHCGLLCNQASVTQTFEHTINVLQNILGKRLISLFNPQHGLQATVQDNMIETNHSIHPQSGLKVYSLYSETREPTEAMFRDLDTLIVDIQIVGCRVYTFKATIASCLIAAKKHHKKVVILDRPNPLGGSIIEGRVLEKKMRSFVGPFELPMRHGLSVGEVAHVLNSEIQAELEVVSMKNWIPEQLWHETQRPWVITSPNLPTFDAVTVYPGTVLLEGTNISEGRGSSLPFQFIGTPYIKNENHIIEKVQQYFGSDFKAATQGLYLRPTTFIPTFHKWSFQSCLGLQIHVLQPEKVRSFKLTLAIIKAFMSLGEDEFQWKKPPYEYEYDTLPMKVILGAEQVEPHFSNFDIHDPYWDEGLSSYIHKIQPFLLYERKDGFQYQ